jgi:hypothetical protein
MSTLDIARAYRRLGLSCIPLKPSEKVPAIRWRPFADRLPTDTDLAGWFRDSSRGIGIICGSVSGGLLVRDFDQQEVFDIWADQFPQWADRLPTVKTARGRHIYFRTTGSARTKVLGDGEMRGDGSYVVAPPSLHPSGCRYAWTVPLGEIPVVDAAEIGLTGCKDETGQLYGEPDEVSGSRSLGFSVTLYKDGLKADEIARLALPTGPHQNHRRLFHLARICRTIGRDRGQNLSSSEVREVFNAWHTAAAPHLRDDQGRESYFMEFISGMKQVKHNIGSEPFAIAWQRALESEPPTELSGIGDPGIIRLGCLCCELQKIHGDEPFYLSSRKAAELLGHPVHTTAAGWLRGFVAMGLLEVVELGRMHRATRYRWRANKQQVER